MPRKSRKQKLLLLTSGGDSPGMNAAIRAVVRSGIYHGLEVFACHDGYCGLIEHKIFPLQPVDVAGCIQNGGTIFRSGRSEAFKRSEVRAEVRDFLKQRGLII